MQCDIRDGSKVREDVIGGHIKERGMGYCHELVAAVPSGYS
jgi:hypothetical protein